MKLTNEGEFLDADGQRVSPKCCQCKEDLECDTILAISEREGLNL